MEKPRMTKPKKERTSDTDKKGSFVEIQKMDREVDISKAINLELDTYASGHWLFFTMCFSNSQLIC